MKNKAYIAVIIILLIIAFAVTVIVDRLPKKDKNGWIHKDLSQIQKQEPLEFYDDMGAVDTEYGVVLVQKSDYEGITAHEFINRVGGILNSFADRTYTTIAFDDGTGIYCPGSSLDEIMTYGKLNSVYSVDVTMTYIEVRGVRVITTEIPYYMSEESMYLSSCLPQSYHNDGYFAGVNEGIIYINVVVNDAYKDTEWIANDLWKTIPEDIPYEEVHIGVNGQGYLVKEGEMTAVTMTAGFIKKSITPPK